MSWKAYLSIFAIIAILLISSILSTQLLFENPVAPEFQETYDQEPECVEELDLVTLLQQEVDQVAPQKYEIVSVNIITERAFEHGLTCMKFSLQCKPKGREAVHQYLPVIYVEGETKRGRTRRAISQLAEQITYQKMKPLF